MLASCFRFASFSIMFIGICLVAAKAEDGRPLLDPTSFHFSPSLQDRAFLRVFNNDDFSVEWKIESFRWIQDSFNKDGLVATDEIMVEPSFVRLQPHTGTDLQINYKSDKVSRDEKTFRVILTSGPITKGDLSVRYTHSVPIFIAAKYPTTRVDISVAESKANQLLLSIGNDGNTHDFVANILIEGLNSQGRKQFSLDRNGWYVLGGQKAIYKVNLSGSDCNHSTRFDAQIVFRSGLKAGAAFTRPLSCGTTQQLETAFEENNTTATKSTSAAEQGQR